MASELDAYKMMTIANLKNKFTNDKNALTNYYNILISNVPKSKLVNKQAQIKKLRTACSQAVTKLLQNLNNAIRRTNAITVVPPYTVIVPVVAPAAVTPVVTPVAVTPVVAPATVTPATVTPATVTPAAVAPVAVTPVVDTAVDPAVAPVSNAKSALLIGCNYAGTNFQLSGCINDVNNIQSFLTKRGGYNKITTLTDNTTSKPNKANILQELKYILTNSKEGDLLFFSFSGHGSNSTDTNGDEKDGKDELIVPLDLRPITDDELKTLIQTNMKKNTTLFFLFDCCHSGTILDLHYQYLDSVNNNNTSENSKNTLTPGTVIMVSGCKDDQTSSDSFINNISQGSLSWSFVKSINENPSITWQELISNMRTLLKNAGYSQIPQLSSGQPLDINAKIFI